MRWWRASRTVPVLPAIVLVLALFVVLVGCGPRSTAGPEMLVAPRATGVGPTGGDRAAVPVRYWRDMESRSGGAGTLALLGDSLSAQSKWAIDAYGQVSGLFTHVDATAGFRTRDKQAAAVRIAASHPRAAVMALGTNDAVCALANSISPGRCASAPTFGLTDMAADLDRMAATLRASGTCVVAVNVYFGREVGDHLQRMVDDGRLDGVVDWRSVAIAEDAYRADALGHLTEAGQEAFARRVVDETVRICELGPVGASQP